MPILDFKGKDIIHSHHLGVPFRSLTVDEKKSVSFKNKNGSKTHPSLDDNLIIHGDNLLALKALLPRYAGKVKCIYIDPPYNTGKETWVFNDNVNSDIIRAWLNSKEVGIDDLERHDKWLCMMWPRLQLLKELLSDDGVIFVSIDDNEQFRLMAIMSEILGEENFLGIFTINSAPNGRDYGHIAQNHEFCLFYAKNIEQCKTNLLPDVSKKFTYKDNEGAFNIHPLYNSNEAFHIKNRPNLYYPFYLYTDKTIKQLGKKFYEIGLEKKKNCIEIYPPLSQKNKIQLVWRWEKNTSLKELNKEIVGYNTSNGDYRIVQKMRTDRKLIRSLISGTDYTSRKGTAEVEEIFKEKKFIFPKPIQLIQNFIKVGSFKNAIILDSFAGSGTTAHAVLDLNKEDGGNRKFILVECEDYADNITAERIRRVIKGVPKAKDEKLKKGLGGTFTYCTLGEEISKESLIKGKSLPSYDTLARYIYYTATGETLKTLDENENFYVGKTKSDTAVFVIYKPNKKFLMSVDSALNLTRQPSILQVMKNKNCKKAYVFATACFLPPEDLKDIKFCQIPFAIHKITGN